MDFAHDQNRKALAFSKFALIAFVHAVLAFLLLQDRLQSTVMRDEMVVKLLPERVKPPPPEPELRAKSIAKAPSGKAAPRRPTIKFKPAVMQEISPQQTDLATVPDSEFEIPAASAGGGANGISGTGKGTLGNGSGGGGGHTPVLVRAVINPDNCERGDYPDAVKRSKETGVVVLAIMVDLDGKVSQTKVMRTSGFDVLDQAARDAMRGCQFKPATIDQVPERSWELFKYTWTVNGR